MSTLAGRNASGLGLPEIFMAGQPQLSQQEMIDRILFIQSLETVRCLDEGVSAFGRRRQSRQHLWLGLCAVHGGTLQFINAYGLDKFVARAQELADRYGERFTPPRYLITMAERGETF